MATTVEHPAPLPGLNNNEIARYSRHLLLPEVGMEGQQKLKAARVLCVGTGGLGAPLAFYLAAAGIGTLGLVDFDVVDESNLQRQIIHSTADVGRPKIDSAADKLKALNPHMKIVKHETMLTSQNALEIIKDYDIVADGTDNFPTRYLVNDACVLSGHKPNAYASIYRFEGQASVFATEDGPCYRCLYPEPPPPGLVPSCAEGGVLGILPGLLGVIQATEVIKLILGKGESLTGRLLLVDSLAMRFRELKLRKNPDCPVCGTHPTVTKLIDYQQFCGIASEPKADSVNGTPVQNGIPQVTAVELKKRLDNNDDIFVSMSANRTNIKLPTWARSSFLWVICRRERASWIKTARLLFTASRAAAARRRRSFWLRTALKRSGIWRVGVPAGRMTWIRQCLSI